MLLAMSKVKKKGPGRPKLRPEHRRRAIEVTLLPTTIEEARAIGGTVSQGIEMAVHEYSRRLRAALDRVKSRPR